jgi:hypothetical protein
MQELTIRQQESARPQENAQTSAQTPSQAWLKKSWPKASSSQCKSLQSDSKRMADYEWLYQMHEMTIRRQEKARPQENVQKSAQTPNQVWLKKSWPKASEHVSGWFCSYMLLVFQLHAVPSCTYVPTLTYADSLLSPSPAVLPMCFMMLCSCSFGHQIKFAHRSFIYKCSCHGVAHWSSNGRRLARPCGCGYTGWWGSSAHNI